MGQRGGGGGDGDDGMGTRAISDGPGLGQEMVILPSEEFSLLGGFSNIGSMGGFSNMGVTGEKSNHPHN